MKWPLITAHSGCMKTPENSIQSVLEGLRAGADVIEVDVRVTKDQVVVLLHDEDVSTPFGSRCLRDLTYEELKCHVKSDVIVPLEDVLPLIKEYNRMINLDIKEDIAIHPMVQAIEEYKMRDYVIFSGCEKERATFIKNHYRPYQVLLNADTNTGLHSLERNYQAFIKETCRDAISAGCCGININYHLCKEELLEIARLRYLPVLVWTIDDLQEMEKFLDMGVHSITSNEVKELLQLRERKMNGNI
ncbi:glycerophosphodiester phosphodiesterase [Bacillus sp. UNC41MFS5]|uniref:glycerophosphodiester phosphodiesterase n=1 Tax=Bacillus sp. UNC41MFS5 TaxID=1449046 RepID=UPI0004799BE9|nr:glycerophosphodiester phosphodiesterase family protein [Bacillus sp. UNC41MFS5]